jgi:hypothetical protein
VLNDSFPALQVYGMEDVSSLFYLPLLVCSCEELAELQALMATNQLVD